MLIDSFSTAARARICALLAVLPFTIAAAVAQTHEHKLGNGLRVIVKEDHRAPTVVAMVWYKAGSIDEFNGTTGVAHVLEHMMFKGTKAVPSGEYSKLVAAAGGRENAFTSRDMTAYHVQVHKSHLPLAFRLEADRMQNLVLTDEEFAKEIRVVMEERRLRTEDQAQGLVYEQFMATALRSHPYRAPVIGWMSDLENMRAEDAREWYQRWYAPNNALVVVVGDVDPKEVFALAERYFGPLKPKALPERKPQDEPAQRGVRRVTVKAPAELSSLIMGYRAPVLRDPEQDWEPYALEMLAGVLDGNEAARLNSSLVRGEKIALSVDAGYESTQRGPGMFLVSGTPAAGRTVAELEQALRREFAKVVNEGVSDEELKRVRAQVVAAQVFQRDSMVFQARQIGALEITGYSHHAIDLMIRKLQEVTAAQVQEVARKYLVDDSLTIAVLEPQPLPGRKPDAAPQGLSHAQ
ncbi:MAG: insulinase family protein [Betaproteobacteria bacterium]|nr:insulinase family protein [Betaproteobacteria bacterium]